RRRHRAGRADGRALELERPAPVPSGTTDRDHALIPTACGMGGRAAERGTSGERARALRLGLLLALALVLGLGGSGCASGPPAREREPIFHVVAPGENLYRIGLRYGVSAAEIARANGIRDVTQLRVGQRLLIPGPPGTSLSRLTRRRPPSDTPLRFAWPVRGRLTSRFGLRGNRPH